MPVGQRLARALTPRRRPWPLLGAAAATFGPASMAELVAPCALSHNRGSTAWGRAYVHGTAPCCSRPPETKDSDEQQSHASASIFDELFPGEARPQRTETQDTPEDGGSEPRPKHKHTASTSAPAREEVLEEIRQWLQSELEAGAAPSRDSHSGDDASKATAPRTLRTPRGDWGASASSAFARSSSRPASADAPSEARAAPRDTQPTVLVLSGTTPSLMPSDFFRIAPRIMDDGNASHSDPIRRPVDGWSASNGGIYKIVQDRDPVTLAPRGRYYLYFGSPAAALAYAQEIRELHTLARRAVVPAETGKSNSRRTIRRRNEDRNAVSSHAGSFFSSSSDAGHGGTDATSGEADPFANVTGSITTGGSGLAINSEGGSVRGSVRGRAVPLVQQKNRRTKNSYSNASLLGMGSEEQLAALRNFSLVVPTVRLHLSVQMPADDQGMYEAKKNKKNNNKKKATAGQVTLYDAEALDDVAATDSTTKVLVVFTLTGNTMSSGSFSHYINADGRGVTTVDGLRSLIAEDGARRNLPWGVSYGLNGVVPVRWLVDEQNRLMRKARAAALQSEHEGVGKEEEGEEEEKKKDEKDDKEADEKHKSPALPTALWASRVPDLTAKKDYMNENARYSRFVVSFSDNAEARRFVRGWHRRTVNVRPEHGLSRSAALAAMDAAFERGDDEEQVTVPAIVEATVLW